MEETWKNGTPCGTATYKQSGSPESGYVYSAQMEGFDVGVEMPHGKQLTHEEVEKLFAADLLKMCPAVGRLERLYGFGAFATVVGRTFG